MSSSERHSPENRLLTKQEVCDQLRISVRTLERLVERGHLASIKLDHAVRFHPKDVEAFIESRRS
jgi:excisionase family DNA binding protein